MLAVLGSFSRAVSEIHLLQISSWSLQLQIICSYFHSGCLASEILHYSILQRIACMSLAQFSLSSCLFLLCVNCCKLVKQSKKAFWMPAVHTVIPFVWCFTKVQESLCTAAECYAKRILAPSYACSYRDSFSVQFYQCTHTYRGGKRCWETDWKLQPTVYASIPKCTFWNAPRH